MTEWGWTLACFFKFGVGAHCVDWFLPDWAFGDVTLGEDLIGQLANHAVVLKITQVFIAGEFNQAESEVGGQVSLVHVKQQLPGRSVNPDAVTLCVFNQMPVAMYAGPGGRVFDETSFDCIGEHESHWVFLCCFI